MGKRKTDADFSELDRAQVLGVYLSVDAGDENDRIDKTYRRLRRRIPKRLLTEWSKRFEWHLYLRSTQRRLFDTVVEDVVERKKRDLEILWSVKGKIWGQITGQRGKDASGREYVIPGVQAKTIGEATAALLDLIRLEREIHGDLPGTGKGDSTGRGMSFLDFIRSTYVINNAPETNKEPTKD